jgi:hypothetical protein
MAIYSEKIIVPADTKEDNPVTLDIMLKEKFITSMAVSFEDGCAWMVGVRIMYGIKQFWPDRKGTWIFGNNETIEWEERFEMPAEGEKLTIVAVSPNTKYDHTIFIRITTLPKGFYFLETLLDRLNKLWSKIIP